MCRFRALVLLSAVAVTLLCSTNAFSQNSGTRHSPPQGLPSGTEKDRDSDERLFVERDLNQDGVLSGTEARGLESLDRDGDKELTKEELRSGRRATASDPVPAKERLRIEADGAFRKLDKTGDGILTGVEKSQADEYDLDQNGEVTADEFVAGYVKQRSAAAWKTIAFAEHGLTCEMPGVPARGSPDAPIRLYASLDVPQPQVRLLVLATKLSYKVEKKPDLFFKAVVDLRKKDQQANVLDEDEAGLDEHPGRLFFLALPDDKFTVLRMIAVDEMVYTLEAEFTKKPGRTEMQFANRFLESFKLTE